MKRTAGYHVAQFDLLWSYKKWFDGDADLGREIMANIGMFSPFGFLLCAILSSFRFSKKMQITVITIAAIIFSFLIETLQLFMMRGMFEWDDLVSNTFGAVIGVGIYGIFEKLLKEKQLSFVSLIIGIAFSIICLGVFIKGGGSIGVEADMTSRAYCFQIDSSNFENGELNLSGFAFRYGQADGKLTLTLRSKEDEVKLITSYGLPRPDVNEYFCCDHDYSNSGFTAIGKIDTGKEYEIIIRWPWSPGLSTGMFITDNDIHYTAEESLSEPDVSDAPDLKDIVDSGTLRVYRPDFHCWVYQKDWDLYWITEPGFAFEEDGMTLIQYQMWTTQTEKLPEKRLENNWLSDNNSDFFEKYEVTGDFGAYRVMRRDIPTVYSVTSIVTGCYKNGEWIWENCFRPIYYFSGGDEP